MIDIFKVLPLLEILVKIHNPNLLKYNIKYTIEMVILFGHHNINQLYFQEDYYIKLQNHIPYIL